jgi:hypothetical protein
MRLLEFNRDTGGANPQTLAAAKPPSKKAARPVKLTPRAATPARSAKVLPLNTAETPATARRPIDLEQLQERIEVLEQRIQTRAQNGAEHPASRDLEILKQRVGRMQQSIHAELWAARQREQAMLEILSRPTFKAALLQRIEGIKTRQLPSTGRWAVTTARQWWLDCQPRWWSAFARAWQESFDKARGLPHN